MRVDRTRVRLLRRGEERPPEERVQMTPEEAMDFVWELSQGIYSSAGHDVDAAMRRDVVAIHGKKN